jgi:hypothetical protein
MIEQLLVATHRRGMRRACGALARDPLANTTTVIGQIGPGASPRLVRAMAERIGHLHGFDVELEVADGCYKVRFRNSAS